MSEVDAGAQPAQQTIDVNPPPVGVAPEAATQAAEPPKEPSLDDTLDAAWDKAQRNGVERADDGKFSSPNGKATQVPAATDSAVEPATEAEPEKPVIEPPNSWTAEARANWVKLPPEIQEYVLKRESESHKAITSQGERLKSYEPLEGLLTEYRDDFARHAIAPDQGIRALLEAQRMFDRDPIGAATTLLLQRGIDIRQLLGQQQGQVPMADPRVGQLDQEVRSLKQHLEQTLQQQTAAQEAADVATVQEFAKDKPHFESVRVLMASLMKDGHAETLQSAYDMAVRAHPDVAKRIETDQRKAAEEKRKADEAKQQDELKRKAQDAAKASKLNVKSGTGTPTPKTLDEDLEAVWARMRG